MLLLTDTSWVAWKESVGAEKIARVLDHKETIDPILAWPCLKDLVGLV